MISEEYLRAQHAVLGSVLIEPQLVHKVIGQTRAEYFTGPAKTVYDAMCRLVEEKVPVDVIAVSSALGEEYRSFLVQLMEVTPTAANVDYYLRLCKEQFRVMALQGIGYEMQAARDADELRELLDRANAMMVDKSAMKICSMADGMRTFMERHVGQREYLSWAIPALNKILFCEKGELILLGGYPSAGKSALALQCCWHWAAKIRVGFFSLETNSEKLFDRLMASVSDLTMEQIKRNRISESEWEHICSLSVDVTERDLEFVPASGMTVAQVQSVTAMRQYDLIVIDYVQLLTAEGFNRTEQVTNISLGLHRLAQNMGVTVVGLSQLKRKDGAEAPSNSDLRESGQLEQDADVVLLLYPSPEEEKRRAGVRVLKVEKNKEGPLGRLELDFDGQHQVFRKAGTPKETVEQFSILTDDDPNMPFRKREPL